MTNKFYTMKSAIKAGVLLMSVMSFAAPAAPDAAEPTDIGTRLELFVDHALIAGIDGDAKLHLHRPEPREVVLVTDEPWEGNISAYFTVFRDDDLYRMYYRGAHYDEDTKKVTHEVVCYAESEDGVNWRKPELGLVEFDGSKKNNIILDKVGAHCFTPFKDDNPNAAPEARYKALSRAGSKGLLAFQSSDGIQWELMTKGHVITKGKFDSQNLAFWDSKAKVYREYHRAMRKGKRDIMTSTSKNFLDWTEPAFLEYPDAPREHLYTNAVLPYDRTPHILLGFPTRYHPGRKHQVEPTLMASRDGRTFHRWLEPIIPVTAPKDRNGNRSNYMAWGLVQLPDNDREYSVYATEAYYKGPDSRLRRFSYRVDGFVSLRGGPDGGSLVTRPVQFHGDSLKLNFKTREKGRIRVELQHADGTPIEGFRLADSEPLAGDEIEGGVRWNSERKLSELNKTPVRIRFEVVNGDLFSYRFHDTK